jgi:hypothetical protein
MAAVTIGVPLTGELEMSLLPCVVPTEAEAVLANIGVRSTVAPCSGLVGKARIESVTAETTVAVVVANLLGSSLDVAVIVTLPGLAGAVQAPVFGFITPALADHVRALVTPPVAVVVNAVELFTVRVGAAGAIELMAMVCGVTVTELSP